MTYENDLLILTSPPASGKTFWIESFVNELGKCPVLVISPLRALANECVLKWGDKIKVMTPEEWLGKPFYADVVIVDEFHLFYYWGDTFRPLMWEAFYDFTFQAKLTILLTATLNEDMVSKVSEFSHFDKILWNDQGNQKLKYSPHKYIKAPSKKWLKDLIFLGPPKNGVGLIFCPFRGEVQSLEKELLGLGFSIWTCLGGEASSFSKKVQTDSPPDFIIATTVLSHGVNLPTISQIFFLYEVKNLDFWIQMVARGGRRGEKFEVFALERPDQLKWNFWTNLLSLVVLNFKLQYQQVQRQLSQWFLKDSL